MDDQSAILYLIPYSPLAFEVAKDPRNARWLRRVELEVDCGVSEREPSISQACDTGEGDDTVTREGTPAAGGDGNRDRVALRLGFDNLVSAKGFTFGRDPDSGIVLPDADNISRHHFRIYFNLDSGVLMLEDTSTFGTSVGNIRLKRDSERNSVALTDEAIHCGHQNSLGFLVQRQDYTGYEARYRNTLRSYISRVSSKSTMYLATPGANSGHRSLSKVYDILEEGVADGAFGIVHTVCRENDGHLFAAKEIKCRLKDGLPSEIKILARISHVSRLMED